MSQPWFLPNMDGTGKTPLFIIEKSKLLRFSEDCRHYHCHTSSQEYMDNRRIFHEWLEELNEDMVRQKKENSLIVDNCPAEMQMKLLQYSKDLSSMKDDLTYSAL